MELFEEALQKWEQALNIRHPHSTSSNNSLALQGAACGDFPMVTMKQSLTVALLTAGLFSSSSSVSYFMEGFHLL